MILFEPRKSPSRISGEPKYLVIAEASGKMTTFFHFRCHRHVAISEEHEMMTFRSQALKFDSNLMLVLRYVEAFVTAL